MRASELAAMLLDLADKHGDPHVYAGTRPSSIVQPVSPDGIRCVEMGVGLSPMLLIVGDTDRPILLKSAAGDAERLW